jgi:hypothetical protein
MKINIRISITLLLFFSIEAFAQTCSDLGDKYLFGTGLQKPDIQEALRLYREGAEGGDLISIMRLIHIYEEGRDGVEINKNEAKKWRIRQQEVFNSQFSEQEKKYEKENLQRLARIQSTEGIFKGGKIQVYARGKRVYMPYEFYLTFIPDFAGTGGPNTLGGITYRAIIKVVWYDDKKKKTVASEHYYTSLVSFNRDRQFFFGDMMTIHGDLGEPLFEYISETRHKPGNYPPQITIDEKDNTLFSVYRVPGINTGKPEVFVPKAGASEKWKSFEKTAKILAYNMLIKRHIITVGNHQLIYLGQESFTAKNRQINSKFYAELLPQSGTSDDKHTLRVLVQTLEEPELESVYYNDMFRTLEGNPRLYGVNENAMQNPTLKEPISKVFEDVLKLYPTIEEIQLFTVHDWQQENLFNEQRIIGKLAVKRFTTRSFYRLNQIQSSLWD